MLLEEVVDVGRQMGRQADAVDDSADGPAAAVGRGGAVGSLETIVPRRRSPQRTPPHYGCGTRDFPTNDHVF